MKYKTSELTGALLDAAVTKVEGDMDCDLSGLPRAVMIHRGSDSRIYAPSTDWRDGGPIIERERIRMIVGSDEGYEDWWIAYIITDKGVETAQQSGDTPLQAAMRAYVFQKFGEEVELP